VGYSLHEFACSCSCCGDNSGTILLFVFRASHQVDCSNGRVGLITTPAGLHRTGEGKSRAMRCMAQEMQKARYQPSPLVNLFGHATQGWPRCARMSKEKCSTPRANSRGQALQTLDRRAKIKQRRPTDDLLNGRPDLDQKLIPLPALGMQGDPFPLTFAAAPRCKRLETEATDGESCHASFAKSVCRLRVGEIVILNEEGMTIHIPADPNKAIRRRRAPGEYAR
jgi:hypothetical protein